MQVKELQSRIEGKLISRTDSGYENLRRQIIWNQLTPPRYPELIVQVASEHDVVEAVRFARMCGMKIAVRGGGHSWVGFPLHDGTLLVDLGRLRQVSIDAEYRIAVVQPAVPGVSSIVNSPR
jgi:FAD/FMN-containing dehydrogenase